jgi:hypothetical protein
VATTSQGIPYPLSSDNNATATDIQALAEFIDSYIWKAGDVRATVSGSPGTGWLAFNQTIVNGQSLYPNLWAVIPTSYKSGSNIVLPNPSDAAIIGTISGVGTVTGSNSVTLAVTNLPSHDHSGPSHKHTQTTHSHTAGSGSTGGHSHTLSATSAGAGNHNHNELAQVVYQGGAGTLGIADGAVWGGVYGAPLNVGLIGTTTQPTHTHTISGTAVSTGSHSHTVTVNAGGGNDTDFGGTGNTGATGSGTSFSVKGKTLELNLYIKT